MAPQKRRKEDDGDEDQPASKASRDSSDSSRKAKFNVHVTALNSQFADWVSSQASQHPTETWIAGVKDYLAHAQKLLADFKDVVDGEKGRSAGAFGAGGVGGSMWGASGSSGGWGSSAATGSNSSPPAGGGGMFGLAGGSAAGLFGAGAGRGGGAGGGGLFGGSTPAGALRPEAPSFAPAAFGNANGPFGATTATDGSSGSKSSSNGSGSFGAAAPSPSGAAAFGFLSSPLPAGKADGAASRDTSIFPTFGAAGAGAKTNGGEGDKDDARDKGVAASGGFSFGSAPAANKEEGGSGGLPAFGAKTGGPGTGLPIPSFAITSSSTAAGSSAAAGTTTSTTTTTAGGWPSGGFAFGGASSSAAAGGDAGAAGTKSTETAGGTATGANSGKAGGTLFNFGAQSAMPQPTFGPTAGGFTGFSFGAGAAAAQPAAAQPAEEEGEEEPQKYESAVEANAEAGTIHFKAKSKFFIMKSGAWDMLGIGQLMVRTRKEDPTKPFITFTTEAGRVLYCANVHKTMKLMVTEAKNTVSWAAAWKPEGAPEGGPALHNVMAQLPKGKYPEIVEAVQKLQAAMP